MGIFGSSEENNEEKVIDSMGHVNNNIIIQEAHDTHEQMRINEKILIITYIMCGLQIFKVGIYLYCKFLKNVKKRYSQTSNNTSS